MNPPNIFDSKTPLPDDSLLAREKSLLGFDARYQKINDQLRLLLHLDKLVAWSQKHHRTALTLCNLVAE